MTIERVRPSETDFGLLPVGVALRTKREQLGWSLADVAAWLRIKLCYLEALEGGQVAKLPGNAYALGFLRAYSRALGLDAEDMSRRFRHETKDINRRPELSFPAPMPERGVPAGAMVLLGVVVVVAVYAGWYEFSGHERRFAHAVPPVPAVLAPYAGPIGTAVPSPQVAAVMPGPSQMPSPLPGTARGASIPASGMGSMGPASIATGAVPTPGGGQSSVAPSDVVAGPHAVPPIAPTTPVTSPAGTPTSAAIGGASPVAGPASVPGQIIVEAVAASWVQVREVGGKVIYDHVLKPGETWAVPQDASPLALSTGNAGGVRLVADGVTSSLLGRVGGVRRAIPLSVQAIRDGSIVTTGASSPETPIPLVTDQDAPAPVAAHRAHPRQEAVPASEDATERLNERQLNGIAPR